MGQDIRVTVIHTADIHSRLFPYRYVPNSPEKDNGLIPDNGPFGGIARIGAIVHRERANAARSIWLDSGDCFQGAPIFNVYKGEAEMRALSLLGVDAAVIGNHEFDLGASNLYEQYVDYIRGLPACTPDQIDETDPAHTVVQNYGVVTCLDAELEQHEGRIHPRFE